MCFTGGSWVLSTYQWNEWIRRLNLFNKDNHSSSSKQQQQKKISFGCSWSVIRFALVGIPFGFFCCVESKLNDRQTTIYPTNVSSLTYFNHLKIYMTPAVRRLTQKKTESTEALALLVCIVDIHSTETIMYNFYLFLLPLEKI